MMQGGAALASRPLVHGTRLAPIDSPTSHCGLFQSSKGFRRLSGGIRRLRPGLVPTSVSTSTPAKSSAGTDVEKEGAEQGDEMFNWYTHWYPILPASFADPSTPYPFTLLGREMVLWRDKEGEWACLRDRCAHRQVPLSRGRFNKDDGNIMCSFHGWRYDKEGKCVNIPQAEADRQEMLCDGKKSRVQSYPVMVKHGAIWVWPDESPKAWVDSSMAETAVPEGMDDIEISDVVVQPIPYTFAAEMLVDPTQMLFTHEELSPYGPADATPRDIEVLEFGPKGFKVTAPDSSAQEANSQCYKQYIFPSTSVTVYTRPDGSKYSSFYIAVPSSPGECRLLTGTYDSNPQGSPGAPWGPPSSVKGGPNIERRSPFLKKVREWIKGALLPPSWKIGLNRCPTDRAYINQDIFILQGKHKALFGKENQWKENYYMPTKSDTGISVFHTWLDKYSKGSVQWAPGTPPDAPVPLEKAFEQWNYHTKHCVHSKETVKGLLALHSQLKKAAALCLAASIVVLLLPNRLSSALAGPGLGLVGACILAAQWLKWRISFFYDTVPPGSPPGNVDLHYRQTTL